jgi:porphobilinogen synthase
MSNDFHIPVRSRRLRQSQWLRDLVAEHKLSCDDLIWPVFVQEGVALTTPISGLPGVSRYSIDHLLIEVQQAADLGIKAIAIFPVVPAEKKSLGGEEALNVNNLVCRAIAAVKNSVPNVGIIADVALDPYTTHGHDGIVENGDVDNDKTVAILCKQAVVLAQAGADIVAPSDMMDGRVGAIRGALDGAGFKQVAILAYSVKYASAFYGPFREAVGSKNALGKADKRSYQMQPSNSREALREVQQDIAEAADMVMVKPGLHYLDVVYLLRSKLQVPVLAYHVSGEYAMLKTAIAAGLLDENTALLETMLAFKRAGADAVLTYAARDIAALL